MSQKDLQRVEAISQYAQGDLACGRAAQLLALSPRHIQRLKARYSARQCSGSGTRQPVLLAHKFSSASLSTGEFPSIIVTLASNTPSGVDISMVPLG